MPRALSLRHRRCKQSSIVTVELSISPITREKHSCPKLPARGGSAQTTVQGEPTFAVEQDFISPPGEHLFGSGEFQDGFLDIRDLPRRLTQVNSQIAIPFLLSSKGYGILWHNYGLTDLNPADERVVLTRSSTGKETAADVTTSEGTRREVRREGEFSGEMEVPRSGRYALMLDVGQKMARRYHVEIDGKVVVDFSNFWLPPTTSWFSDLSAGRHTIRIIGAAG